MTERSSRRTGLWQNRNFTLLLSGQVVSFVGGQLQIFAMPLLVLAVFHSPTDAGIVLSISTFSWLAFGLIAGALADRWNRKTTMIACDLGRAAVIISVPVALWLHGLTMAQLCVVAALNGLLETLFESADSASIPNVVPAEQLPAALGVYESAINAVRIGGSLVAGALYTLSRALPFLADGVSYLCSAISLRFIKTEFQEEPDADGPAETPGNLITEIRAGVSWLYRQRLVRFLVLITAADMLRYGAGYLVIITLAQRLGASAVQIGFVFTGAAIGALAGSLAAVKMNERYTLGRIVIVTLWVEALLFPLYAYAPSVWLLAAVAAGESVVAPIYSVAISSYQMLITPDDLRGRASSAVNTLTTAAMSLGALLGGVLIASIGPRATALSFAAWLLVLAVLTTANRTVRRSAVMASADLSQPQAERVDD